MNEGRPGGRSDTLNVVRRSTVWRQPRTTKLPPGDHPSFFEHDAICVAIMAHDEALASQRMRDHLNSVRERVLPTLARLASEQVM